MSESMKRSGLIHRITDAAMQSNPVRFGLDWIQRFAEAWIMDWTELQNIS